jgi:hypothetical protein
MRIGYGRVCVYPPPTKIPAPSTTRSPQPAANRSSSTSPPANSLPAPNSTRRYWSRTGPATSWWSKSSTGSAAPSHLIELSKDLQTRGVDLVVLDQGIDTSTAVGRMFFQILGAIAEFEHALMSERTRDGLAAARARGRTGGQKPKLGPRQVQLARQMYDEHDDIGKRRYTVAQIDAEFGVTPPTIYRHLTAAGIGS